MAKEDKSGEDEKELKRIKNKNLILVEGKTDMAIIEAIIESIEPYYNSKVQILELEGKNKLRTMENLIKNSDIEIEAILLILDKDKNFESTKQMAENFLDKLPSIKKSYIILPPEDMEGQELEDYIVEILLQNDDKKDKISYIKECVSQFQSDKKLGKKIFYTYLLLNDDCNYQGTSFSSLQIKNCISNIMDENNYIVKQIRLFLNSTNIN